MPVSDQANQMSMLQQAMQQAIAQQQMQGMLQKMIQQPPQGPQSAPQASPTGQGQGLAALLGGQGAMGQGGGSPQQPPTLGLGGALPMQMPQADPQGQQQQPPLPPDPTAMGS